MMNHKRLVFAALTALSSVVHASLPAPILVNLQSSVVGGLYRPETIGPAAAIAIFVMHSESDYIDFGVCHQMAARGYTVLCADTPGSKYSDDTDVYFEGMMAAVALGVEFLRNQTDIIDKVVLWGHSGGGAMMSAYQNIAENGISACNGTEKLWPCSQQLEGLPPADGIMLIDANYGMSSMFLLSLSPVIVDETSSILQNYNLSVYNPANGFNDNGPSNYTPEFTKAFMSAMAKRMQSIVAYALDRYAVIIAGDGPYVDDETMTIPAGAYGVQNNLFFSQDPRFLSHTNYPWPLLHKDGSITTEVVHTVRVPTNFGPSDADTYSNGAVKTSVTRFLGGYGMRVSDDFSFNATDFTGVQWNSSHMVPIQAVPGIRVPLLTMGMTGHWEFLNAEKIYLNSGSDDTTICFVEGAEHTINTCTQCERYPGEFGNTTLTAYNYMADWLREEGRFL